MFDHSRIARVSALLAATSLAVLATACGADAPEAQTSASGSGAASAQPSGELTVLTWRTDLVEDGTFDAYVKTFNQTYPDVDVEIEGITNYEGEVRTRMNTADYGDVLAIPGTITPDQLSQFFVPLGDQAEMEKTYRWLADKSFEGTSYGIPVVGNANGVLYNKRVWTAAGITDLPTTPADFLADLATIKAAQPDVVPLYTNYKDGWPLTAWESYRGGVSGDADAANELTTDDAPWAEGKEHAVIDGLLYDAVAQKLTEDDPTSTNWELSKTMMGDGKIATMLLGSWAIPQIQAAATEGGQAASDIAYMPFPTQAGGTSYAVTGGDYNLAINKNTENPTAARAWLDWFINDSGYSLAQSGLSPQINGATPDTLKDFEATGVKYLTLNPAPAGQESLLSDIDKAAEIGLTAPDYRKKIVDAARSGDETKQQIFDDLNSRWAKARASVG